MGTSLTLGAYFTGMAPLNIPFLNKTDSTLPGGMTHPTWVVLDMHGPYPARQPASPLAALLNRTETLEALEARIEKLGDAEWLHGVLVRFGDFTAAPAAAHAVRGMLGRLAQNKRVVAHLPQLTMTALIAASGATEIAAPESADVMLGGFAVEQTYLGEPSSKSTASSSRI